MYLGQQQDRSSSPAKNSTPTDQPQRKAVGRWCLAGNVERPGVVSWLIEVVAVRRRWRYSRNPLGSENSSPDSFECLMPQTYLNHVAPSVELTIKCEQSNTNNFQRALCNNLERLRLTQGKRKQHVFVLVLLRIIFYSDVVQQM